MITFIRVWMCKEYMETGKVLLVVVLFAIGYLIGWLPLLFGTLLFLCALSDMKKKHLVPDVYLAGLWLVVWVGGVNHWLLVAAFSCLFAINAYLAHTKHKPMGWADVLGLPPFLAVMWLYGGVGVVACAVGFLLFDFDARHKGAPLFPFLNAIFWAAVICGLLL